MVVIDRVDESVAVIDPARPEAAEILAAARGLTAVPPDAIDDEIPAGASADEQSTTEP